ncbi:MATE family efflux transporter [Candidatus Peregrinibacteria bacterium CG10_big_fil_rev_8_21_14_0_10_49_10]|nr:MAG: MATE family efflux transporter [Candidatus Peregrinibacteria bacterium CG10_big_fil_rev_8_21_14_0_10_49_10]
MQQQSSYTEGSIIGAMVRLSLPIIMANVLQTAYQITDTFWVGRLSAQAVAAVSLSFPVNFLLIALGGGLALAGSILIALYKGKGDDEMMNHTAAQTLLMVMAVSVLLSGVGYVLSEPIMRVMGAAPDVLPDAVRFAQITFLGFVFVFAYFVYQSLMRGVGIVKGPMYIVLLTVILNLFLDPLFIFGYGMVPAMGVSGAAMATLVTQAVATAIGFALLFRGKNGFALKRVHFKPDWVFMRRAFLLGLPASIEQSTRALGMVVMTILVATFGTITIAAYGTGIRVLTFVIIPAMGLSLATSTLVGQNMGAGKVERAARTNLIGTILAFTVLTAIGALLFPFALPLTRIFIPQGGAAIEQSAAFVRIMALTFGFIGVQQVTIGTLRGAGDTKASMVIAVVAQWCIQFPLAYMLAYHTSLGEEGLWWSFAVSNIISATIAVLWLARGSWKLKKLIPDEKVLKRQVSQEALADEGIAA